MSDTSQTIQPGKGKSEADIAALMMQLDLASADDAAGGDAMEQRFSYRQKCNVNIQQPGDGTPSRHTIMPRNLGKSGMFFLHSGYVHTGSVCVIQLITLQGSWCDVVGVVKGCGYVGHNLHEVSVQFKDPIEPTEYCRDAIRNRVLIIDDDVLMARLTKILLEKLNADVETACNGREGIEKAMSSVFDLVMMDVEMPELDGIEATQELRKRGYSGIIMAATAHTQPEDRDRCLKAGCDDFIPKPYLEDTLAQALASVQQKPIYSAFADDPSMMELVSTFVADLPERLRVLEESMLADDVERLQTMARALKAEGSSYGFEGVTSLAGSIEQRLIENTTTADLRKDVDRLAKMCLQIRSSARSDVAPAAS